jgi:hypothetical protein
MQQNRIVNMQNKIIAPYGLDACRYNAIEKQDRIRNKQDGVIMLLAQQIFLYHTTGTLYNRVLF